ncbi:MAG TPA: membrane protein insertase YidC, partial [Candidatus Limnocylindrales bacterium]
MTTLARPSLIRRPIVRLALALGLVVVAMLVLAACSPIEPSAAPGASSVAGASVLPGTSGGAVTPAAPTSVPTATAEPTPLIVSPANLDANPVAVLAWLFNPIFQLFLIMLVGIHSVVGDMGISIIVTTLIVRTALVPLMRRQMVSMRRMQAIAPEIKEIQRRFKSDRLKQQQATTALYKERGVSQAGCLVALLPILLILPMYQVVREGLQAADLTASLQVFGF